MEIDRRIRLIDVNDIQLIREWKNKNKRSFFFKEEIDAEMQLLWFKAYEKRGDDHMFVAELKENEHWISYGCLAYRVRDGVIDLYNIIRGRRFEFPSSMSWALKEMISVIKKETMLPIQCDVLVDNPAVSWYTKCGFVIDHEEDGYYVMKYDGE